MHYNDVSMSITAFQITVLPHQVAGMRKALPREDAIMVRRCGATLCAGTCYGDTWQYDALLNICPCNVHFPRSLLLNGNALFDMVRLFSRNISIKCGEKNSTARKSITGWRWPMVYTPNKNSSQS